MQPLVCSSQSPNADLSFSWEIAASKSNMVGPFTSRVEHLLAINAAASKQTSEANWLHQKPDTDSRGFCRFLIFNFFCVRGFLPWRNHESLLFKTDGAGCLPAWHVVMSSKEESSGCVVLHVNTGTLREWWGCFFKAEQPGVRPMNYLQGWGKHDAFSEGREAVVGCDEGAPHECARTHVRLLSRKNIWAGLR